MLGCGGRNDADISETVRQYPERPIVGVGAVVVGPEGVLLVRRAHAPMRGEWSLPGGAVEVGETLAEAVVREVHEETGLDVEVGPLLDAVDVIRRDVDGRVEYHYVLVDYLCLPIGGTLCSSSDASEACWVAPLDLPAYRLNTHTLAVIANGVERSRQD